MPATISQVTGGLADRLRTIDGLAVYEYQPDTVYNPPLAFPSIVSVEYHRAFADGGVTMTGTITVLVGRVSEKAAQDLLDEFASYSGARSVRAAIEADTTLDGAVDTLVVPRTASISAVKIGDADFFSLEIEVQVYCGRATS